MCSPADAGAVVTIIGDNTNRQLQKGQENQKRLAVNDQIAENRRRATADYVAQTSDENLKMTQEHQANAEKFNDNTKTLVKANSDADVAAAEGNVAGHNLDAIHSDYALQNDLANGRIATNQQWADYQHTRNDVGYEKTYENRSMSIQPYQMAVQKPVDYFGPVFKALDSDSKTAMAAAGA